jgi:peptidyl-prolyl cis-trans isomerase SurA
MKFKILLSALALLVVCSGSSQVASHGQTLIAKQTAAAAPQATGKPVARVNGTVLTDQDLLREMYTIFPYAKQHNGFPKDMEPGIREGALKMIVFDELAYQDAQRRNMQVPADKLAKAQAQFRKQFKTNTEYQLFLKSGFGGSEKALNAKIRRSLLIDQYLKVEVNDKSTVTVAEAKAYYEKNPKRFEYPEGFAFQSISTIPPDKATPDQLKDAKKRADEAYKQAKATKTAEEFGLLAEKISEDDYRVMLGDHKWVDRSKLPPNVANALASMKKDDVSSLLQVEQAYVVVRLNGHRPAGKAKFEEVKATLIPDLEKRKTNEVRAALDKKLQQNAKVEVL